MITMTRPGTTARTAHRLALDGARDITPMVIGVLPFGLAIGATVGSSSVPALAGLASAPLVLAGAAQITMIEMLDAGAAPLVIILSAIMINARLLLYSTSLAPWFKDEPLRRRLLLAVPVIDQLHFTCVPRFERGDLDATGRRWYYTGAAAWLATAWVTTNSIAVIAGATLPEWSGLHVAAPLALAGLLARSITDHVTSGAALAAGIVAVAGVGLPFHSATLVAAIAGITVGTLIKGTSMKGISMKGTSITNGAGITNGVGVKRIGEVRS